MPIVLNRLPNPKIFSDIFFFNADPLGTTFMLSVGFNPFHEENYTHTVFQVIFLIIFKVSWVKERMPYIHNNYFQFFLKNVDF